MIRLEKWRTRALELYDFYEWKRWVPGHGRKGKVGYEVAMNWISRVARTEYSSYELMGSIRQRWIGVPSLTCCICRRYSHRANPRVTTISRKIDQIAPAINYMGKNLVSSTQGFLIQKKTQ